MILCACKIHILANIISNHIFFFKTLSKVLRTNWISVEFSSRTTSLPSVHGSHELGSTIDYHKILRIFTNKWNMQWRVICYRKETIIPRQWIRYFDIETFAPAAVPSGSSVCQQQKTHVLTCCWQRVRYGIHFSGKVGKQWELLLVSLPPSQLVNRPCCQDLKISNC